MSLNVIDDLKTRNVLVLLAVLFILIFFPRNKMKLMIGFLQNSCI